MNIHIFRLSALVLLLEVVGCSSDTSEESALDDSGAGAGPACVGTCPGSSGGRGDESPNGQGGREDDAAAAGKNGSQGGGGVSSGGRAPQGGSETGGVSSGGGTAQGGSASSGGRMSGGSSGGSLSSGGGTSSGGGISSGGAGGAGSIPPGACKRPVGSCTAPEVRISEVDLGISIARYGREGDTEPLPLAIGAMPSGGSRVAALGNDGQVHVGELDCNDQLVGAPFAIPAIDLQDLHADDEGGVVLVTRDATNGGTDQCGNGTLCGGQSSPCRSMWMVRFNAAGQVQWETQVTNLSEGLAGYQDRARFIWWYQHHGRLAFDGTNYAAYFGVAITVNNSSCVDIHQGDRMQVVGSDGTLQARHPDAFEVGCSHAWQSRIVWDPREKRFAMVCTTDNNCRIAQPNPYRTVAQGTCDGSLFGGDLVLASTPGYWTAWSQGGQIRLEHFTTGASDKTIADVGPSEHPHLVSYGASRMLVSWESGSSLTAQVRDSGSGEVIGSPFTIDVADHSFQAFKDYQDGSVAYPASGTGRTQLRVARVMPCE